MLQIDHIYEFFYNIVFNKNIETYSLFEGVPKDSPEVNDLSIWTPNLYGYEKALFYDQEPLLPNFIEPYINIFTWREKHSIEWHKENLAKLGDPVPDDIHELNLKDPNRVYKPNSILVTSEKSQYLNELLEKHKLYNLYYFFHGFAALDWFRGYYSLNYNKSVVKQQKDFITYNRLITEDRSYRIYFISQLAKHNLLDKGLVSFGVSNDGQHWRDELERNDHSKLSDHARQEIWNTLPDLPERLIIDNEYCLGNASSRVPYSIDNINDIKNINYNAFWHIVTETVFYYDKLHLTEKIFKPIVSKQPFMLIGAPGNLEYLRSYGFKTFDSVIDESYDTIQDNDDRIDAVVKQLNWYCNLSDSDKLDVMKKLEPIIEYNFHHFYGEFKNVIVNELITNCENLFTEIDYQHSVDFDLIKKILLN